MIFRIEVSMEFITKYFYTGKVIQRTQVTKGLPPGARFFHAYANDQGNWCLLFEGKPETGPDTEGAVRDLRIELTSIYGDTPLPIPELIPEREDLI